MRERPAEGMAWAVHSQTKTPVYIGSIAREKTGLKCGCMCPACDAPLQAVGAGTDARSGRTPFFRHHNARQGPGCKYRVAELAALKLLAERGLIEIPAPRKTAAYRGVSGQIYQSEQVGEAIKEAIVERRLVSAVQAVLTLESGRQVALVLRGHQNVGELGSVFAVIEVEVNDPEVAWMSPDEIIARSELSRGEWLHVVKHQDDERLSREAEEDARRQALEKIDLDPALLGLREGATGKQASESILHWVIKDALLNLKTLMAPEFRESVHAVGKDGDLHTVEVKIPSTRLLITDVVDEVPFDGYKPDIVCFARDQRGTLGQFRLLIEVAVTSRVTQVKLGMIKRDNMACIELDVRHFSQCGYASRAEVVEIVANDLQCKAWLHHPHIPAMLADAQKNANRARDEADARKAAAEAQAQEKARLKRERIQREEQEAENKRTWARSLDRTKAMQELRVLLERRWSGKAPTTSNGMNWSIEDFSEAIGNVSSLALLGQRFTSDDGILRRLLDIVRVSRSASAHLNFKAATGTTRNFQPSDLYPWLGLIHLAIEHFQPLMDREQYNAYREQRDLVMNSLIAGKTTFARPSGLDIELRAMFPELAQVLAGELGTRAYCDRLRLEHEAAARAEREAAEAAAAAALAVKAKRDAEEAAAEAERAAAKAAEEERRRLPEAIALVGFRMVWRPNLKVPPTAKDAVQYLKLTGNPNPSHQIIDLVKEGWAARRDKLVFAEWFADRKYDSVDEVHAASKNLSDAFLIQPKPSPGGAVQKGGRLRR